MLEVAQDLAQVLEESQDLARLPPLALWLGWSLPPLDLTGSAAASGSGAGGGSGLTGLDLFALSLALFCLQRLH
ncbi:hypothetical protein ES703_95138 [subsurface metagenome]